MSSSRLLMHFVCALWCLQCEMQLGAPAAVVMSDHSKKEKLDNCEPCFSTLTVFFLSSVHVGATGVLLHVLSVEGRLRCKMLWMVMMEGTRNQLGHLRRLWKSEPRMGRYDCRGKPIRHVSHFVSHLWSLFHEPLLSAYTWSTHTTLLHLIIAAWFIPFFMFRSLISGYELTQTSFLRADQYFILRLNVQGCC